MVTLKTADWPFEVDEGRATKPHLPSLVVTQHLDVLGVRMILLRSDHPAVYWLSVE